MSFYKLFIYLFIYYGLFDNVCLLLSHTTQHRMVKWSVNNQSERMWKETVAAQFGILSPWLPEDLGSRGNNSLRTIGD
jgi:hypothetical protein